MKLLRVSAVEARELEEQLAQLIKACVDGGASVNFLAPMPIEMARAFWGKVVAGLEAGDRAMLVAVEAGKLLGTAQVVFAPQPNQPHRADVVKVLVSPDARRRGIGMALMGEVEAVARSAGRTLLTLDTVEGDPGEPLYVRCGFTKFGVVPNFALTPHGKLCNAAFFYKHLDATA